MFLTGGMLITACAVYEFDSSKDADVMKLITSEAVSGSVPEYTENCEIIKNLVIQDLQEKGLWLPGQPVTGAEAVSFPVGCYVSDKEYAQLYMKANYRNPATDKGVSSVSCWIEEGYVWISASFSDFPGQ